MRARLDEDEVETLTTGSRWTLAPAPCAHVLDVGGRTILFCERTQRLSELNGEAAALWARLANGELDIEIDAGGVRVLARGVECGASAAPLAREWLMRGHAAPAAMLTDVDATPNESRPLAIVSEPFELRFHGDAPPPHVEAVFGHLAADPLAPIAKKGAKREAQRGVLSVFAAAGAYFCFFDGAPIGVAGAGRVVAKIKAALTEELLRRGGEGFWAHGALLGAHGKRVLITGEPGAGKSTLALALAARGFRYMGDDIVRIGSDGAAQGAPFAAAAKSGSWPRLKALGVDVDALPVQERSDGQRVRYVVPQTLDEDGPRPVDVVILLSADVAEAPRLEPAEPLEALVSLLASGFSDKSAIDAQTLANLARTLSSAACRRLGRIEPAEAAALVERAISERSS